MLQEVTENRRGKGYKLIEAASATDVPLKCDVCRCNATWAVQPSNTSLYSYACDRHVADVMSMTNEKCYFVVHPLNIGPIN